ncbi:MAG: flagellar motor protein MotB, partial [Chitinophagaceae bacterium]
TNTQQPAITPDGKKLLFASDRPGGLGGFDLYSAELNADGSTGAATNLGSNINTAFDEQAPYYHKASSTLVFASNGRVGMGEYDLFYVKDSAGASVTPQNFGYPVNSIKDDIYFASKGTARNILEDVLFSSDRASACCLELFHLQKRPTLKQISGQVLACDGKSPLPNAVVTIVDTVANKILYNLTTDASGRFVFTLEEYQPLKVVASTANFYTGSVELARPADPDQEQLTAPELCLQAIQLNAPMIVDNVYYEFAEAEVKPESYGELDRLVRLMNENPTIVAEISAHTDSKGTDDYNQRLSEARARSVVNYLVSKGVSAERLVVKGYGETKPIAPNENPDGSDNPEGRERNRRTEFKVIKN